MTISRHQREAEALAARLRRKNAAGGKRLTKIKIKRAVGRASKNAGSWKGRSLASVVKIHKGGRAGDHYSQKAIGAEFIDSNMLGRDSKERDVEWDLDQAQHPNFKHLFCHVSISLAGGKKLSRREWKNFVKGWLSEIGAEGVNYIAIRHTNSDHDHAHIVFSRNLPNGKLLSTAHNFYRWREALRRAEEMNGLKPIEIEKPKEAMTSQSDTQVNAVRRAMRRGTTANHINPEIVDACLRNSTTMTSFEVELKKFGIEMHISKRDNGDARGIVFRKLGAEEFLAGSSVSRDLTLPKVQAALATNQVMNQRNGYLNSQRMQQQRLAQQVVQQRQRPPRPMP